MTAPSIDPLRIVGWVWHEGVVLLEAESPHPVTGTDLIVITPAQVDLLHQFVKDHRHALPRIHPNQAMVEDYIADEVME